MRLGKRLTKVAKALARDRAENELRTVVYLPRKDSDSQPAGVLSRTGTVLTVLYDRGRPDPPLPDGW